MKILLQIYVWPELTSSAAGLRDENLIATFLAEGWDVTVASGAKKNEYEAALASRGIPTFSCEPNDPRYDIFLRELSPDIVIFDRFVTEEQFSFRVREICPDALRVLDTQDLHFVRRAREAAVQGGGDARDADFFTDDSLRELASIYRSDLSWVLSSYEARLLGERCAIPKMLVEISRFQYDLKNQPLSKSFFEREGYVWIGNFRHPPNADGLTWLKKEIWPLVRKEDPAALIRVYGAYPPKEYMQMHAPAEGFFMEGWAKDQFEVLGQAKVNCAPLRFGAGIKGKITDAWFTSTPTVTTWVGAEGLTDSVETLGVKVAETDPVHFARLMLELAQNEKEWSRVKSEAAQCLKECYSHDTNRRKMISDLKRAMDRMKDSRRQNLVGAMLWHQGNRSTHYFSKWIEEKNRHKSG